MLAKEFQLNVQNSHGVEEPVWWYLLIIPTQEAKTGGTPGLTGQLALGRSVPHSKFKATWDPAFKEREG